MDYLVLMQRAWHDDPDYLDVEGVIYHYPERYFPFIGGYERFVYYRPAKGAPAAEASAYIGFGTLGTPFPDPNDRTHRFVPIRQYQPFAEPVAYIDPGGRFYESDYFSRTAFTGRSVRRIAPTDFFRILALGGAVGDPFSVLADTETVIAAPYSAFVADAPPTQPLRVVTEIPPGTGYRPSGKPVDVVESAALQERARDDHQATLRIVQRLVHERGGTTLLNNNVDLLANVRGERLLVEAKSVTSDTVVVDRMRYGIGQLADYRVRYRSDVGDAKRVLAFGRVPAATNRWVATILQESGIAFVAWDRTADRVVPLNARAHSLPLFASP